MNHVLHLLGLFAWTSWRPSASRVILIALLCLTVAPRCFAQVEVTGLDALVARHPDLKVTPSDYSYAYGTQLLEGLSLRLYSEKYGDGDLALLGSVSGISILDLTKSRVTDEGLRDLVRIRGLQCLILNNTAVSDAGMERLLFLKDLRALELKGTRVTEAGLKTLSRHAGLERLCLPNTFNRVQIDAGFPALVQVGLPRYLHSVRIAHLPRLQFLDIVPADWRDHFEPLVVRDLPALKRLSITEPEGGQEYLTIRDLPALEELYLSCSVQHGDLRPLTTMKRLRVVWLIGGGDPRAAMVGAEVEFLGSHDSLEELRLIEIGIPPSKAKFLATLPNLERLTIQNCQLEGSALRYLAGLKKLQEAYLPGNRFLYGEDIAHLASLPMLRDVTLSDCHLPPDALKYLAKLPELRYLNVSGNDRITDDSLRDLADTQIATLAVGWCALDGTCLTTLAKIPTLNSLDLQGNRLAPGALARLLPFPKLTCLNLEYALPADGIATLEQMPFLKVVYLSTGQLTSEDFERLRASLPHAMFYLRDELGPSDVGTKESP